MPPRIPDDKRQAILEDILEEKLSARAIGRKHGVAQSTVSLIARENEADGAFDRTKTERATRARQTDNRARRAQLASDLLSDAEKLRRQLWEPTTIGAFGGREGDWHTAEVEEPPFSDKRAILSSVQTAVRAHTDLEKVDATGSADGAVSMLGKLAAGLKQAWEESESAGGPAAEPQAAGERGDE